MTFDINSWCELFAGKVQKTFGEKLLFIGLQGSYKREEANDDSDIDMVVILKNLTITDLDKYKSIINSMPNKEKACGFIGGENEVRNWTKSELFHLLYDTKAVYKSLENIVPHITQEDIKYALKAEATSLYHALCHSYLYDEDRKSSLEILAKQIFFILQCKYFLKNNEYIPTKNELLKNLYEADKKILELCINRHNIHNFEETQLKEAYNSLISWCSRLITSQKNEAL